MPVGRLQLANDPHHTTVIPARTILALSDLAHEVCEAELSAVSLRSMASRLLIEHADAIRAAALAVKVHDKEQTP